MSIEQYLIGAGTGIEILGVMMIAWPSVIEFFGRVIKLSYQTLPNTGWNGLKKRTLRGNVGIKGSLGVRHRLGSDPDIDRVVEWATAELERAEEKLIERIGDEVHRVENKFERVQQKFRADLDEKLRLLESRLGGVAKYPNVRGWGVGVVIVGLVLVSSGSIVSISD